MVNGKGQTMKKFLFLVLALLSSAVFAQALPVGASPVYPYTLSGNVATFSGATANAANAASITFANASNGPIYAQAPASLGLGGGHSAAVQVKAFPTPYAISRAVGTFIGKALPLLGAGIALYELAKELGFDLDNSSGAVVVKKVDSTVCTVAPCYAYAVPLYGQMSNSVASGYKGSKVEACEAARASWEPVVPAQYKPVGVQVGSTVCVVFSAQYGWTKLADHAITSGTVAPQSTNLSPATQQELIDAIAAKSGWPSSSALPQTLKDAVTAGVPLELPSPSQITGPAFVPLAPSTVVHPDGSQTVTQPNKNLTYSPPSVTSTDATTVTELRPDGTPVAPPTSETKPSEFPETCGYPGGPPCKIDEAGTPEKAKETDYNPKADQLKIKKDEALDKIAGAADKNTLYNNYSMFFRAPAFVACEPIPLPEFKGVSMGAIDACSVVDGMREVMGYLWAFGGLILCLGFIRQTV